MGATFKQDAIDLRERLDTLEGVKPIPSNVIVSNTAFVPASNMIKSVVSLSQLDYDALALYDDEILYVIVG